jgi:hypothetical protein
MDKFISPVQDIINFDTELQICGIIATHVTSQHQYFVLLAMNKNRRKLYARNFGQNSLCSINTAAGNPFTNSMATLHDILTSND